MTVKHHSDHTRTLLHYFRRDDVFVKESPSRRLLSDVSSRWSTLVLFALLENTYRFSELKRKINGISEKMLAQTLQILEADGFILRAELPVSPPHVEYSLTEYGQGIAVRIKEVIIWIELNAGDLMQASSR